MEIWKKLTNLDRRIVYLIIGIVVLIPLLLNVTLKVDTSKAVKDIYDKIERMEPGSTIMLSFDYAASSKPELQPMTVVLLKHAFENDINVVGVALWPIGVDLGNNAFASVKKQYENVKYGKDFVNLGYTPGGLVAIDSMKYSMKETFPNDYKGTDVEKIPMMRNINKLDDFSLIVSLSAGDPGLKHYVMIAKDQLNVPVAGGCTAVTAPRMYAYYNSGQLIGLMGGLRGAAEYENVLGEYGTASEGMTAQDWAHVAIIIFIIIGNISMFMVKKNKDKEKMSR